VTAVYGVPAPPAAGEQEIRRPSSTVLESVLDDLEDDALDEDVVIYGVPRRPGWEVRYLASIDDTEQLTWREVARDPSSPIGVNRLLLAQVALAAKCVGILKDGEDVTDSAGQPVTFASPAFQAKLRVKSTEQAVQAFYRRDPDVLAASDELQRDSGWAGGVPTKRR
jgi:hypothetical protein